MYKAQSVEGKSPYHVDLAIQIQNASEDINLVNICNYFFPLQDNHS